MTTTGRLYRAPRRWPAMVAVAAAGVLVGAGTGAGVMALTTDRPAAAVAVAHAELAAVAQLVERVAVAEVLLKREHEGEAHVRDEGPVVEALGHCR